ncbi:hypothetical protein SAMN02927914_03293 [Mesorhizobium qingshengii]|uniref:Uncharacterized protein n=1 Tax=Mesorhizobium qingshengii TaxID=1165689 RepID=A0A1G5YHA9_9HYPH|nr:hypothetical protein SAMN02927914_03293 [Mesorhizobium qingshengii]
MDEAAPEIWLQPRRGGFAKSPGLPAWVVKKATARGRVSETHEGTDIAIRFLGWRVDLWAP